MPLGFDLLKQVNVVDKAPGQHQPWRSTQIFQLCWTQTSRGGTEECNARSCLDFLCGVFNSQGFA